MVDGGVRVTRQGFSGYRDEVDIAVSQQRTATKRARCRSLVELLAGPISARAVTVQVLAGLGAGAVAFGALSAAIVLHAAAATPQAPSALLLTAGSLGRGQAQAVTDDLGWAVTRTTHRGLGFAPARRGGPSLTQQVRTDPDVAAAEIVVVQGGEVDTGRRPADLSTATLHLLDWLEVHTAGGATIVLQGPVPGADQTPADLRGVDAVLAAAAQQRGVPYLSALDAGLSRSDPAYGTRLAGQLRRLVG